MTGAGELFLWVGGFLLVLSAVALVAERIIGPDPDLNGPWTPGDRPWWKP